MNFEDHSNGCRNLAYDDAKRKLLHCYGMPERIHVKSMKDVEEVVHARMCEGADEQHGRCLLLPGVGMDVEI